MPAGHATLPTFQRSKPVFRIDSKGEADNAVSGSPVCLGYPAGSSMPFISYDENYSS